jgi:hypothetical protein
VASVQVKIEQIEVVILSVYLAELWHMIADGNKDLLAGLKPLDVRYEHWFREHEHFISWSVFFVAVSALCWFGVAMLRNWKGWGYKLIAAGAVLTFAVGVFVSPWGWLFRGVESDDARRAWSYVVASLAAVAAAVLMAYVLKPWRDPEPHGKGAPAKAP